jgi:hypothetical protein
MGLFWFGYTGAMSQTGKSPKAILRVGRALPVYSHRFSPQKFTQAQLFACLVLKKVLKTDYRGVAALTHNIAIILCFKELFYRACPTPLIALGSRGLVLSLVSQSCHRVGTRHDALFVNNT